LLNRGLDGMREFFCKSDVTMSAWKKLVGLHAVFIYQREHSEIGWEFFYRTDHLRLAFEALAAAVKSNFIFSDVVAYIV
jgi:hypothetical protein